MKRLVRHFPDAGQAVDSWQENKKTNLSGRPGFKIIKEKSGGFGLITVGFSQLNVTDTTIFGFSHICSYMRLKPILFDSCCQSAKADCNIYP